MIFYFIKFPSYKEIRKSAAIYKQKFLIFTRKLLLVTAELKKKSAILLDIKIL